MNILRSAVSCKLLLARKCRSHLTFQRLFMTLLSNPSVKEYLEAISKKSIEIIDLPLANIVNKKIELERELLLLSSLSDNDKEMLKLIQEERSKFLHYIEEVNKDILSYLLPTVEERDIVLEITAGVGGKEAMHFANELFNMYCNYCSFKSWSCEVQEIDTPEGGGLRHSSTFISGRHAFNSFSQECGVHRVQRVPATERSGRIHTSTVTVAVLPQPTEFEVVLNDKDLKVETKTSSGAGGQHVNKTESCVRLTHIPTGIVIENQTERSQIKNKQIAMQRLRSKLYHMELDGFMLKTASSRKEQVGSSSRSEKIRTYNFNQDRVTDHRVGISLHNLPGFLEGGKDLDLLMTRLLERHNEQQLLQVIEQQLRSMNSKNV